ncbi:MAG: hypothetical protein EXS05_11665 [Planctomycetaceae bacterium]|nr:hypothetical protein [Planctomycetaceae bacterium]
MENGLLSLEQFLGLQVAGLDSCDILTRNLCAGRGLPGTENSTPDVWFPKRDQWIGRIKFEICRHLYRFDSQANQEPTPYSYGNSLARFFCWHMLQVLQVHCGVRYQPDRKFKPDFCQPRDVFVHGIMDDDGEGGTCASMPVVYVSVGRALGFPVYLVETRGHAFFRWDDPKGTTIRWENPDLVLWIPPDRFNIEGSGEGIAYYTDSYYTQWPELWTEIDIRHGKYLRSMTPKEELAGFLIERGECFWDLGNKVEALKSYYFARQLAPDDERYKWVHAKRSHEYQQWEIEQREMKRIEQELEEMTRDAERRRRRMQGAETIDHGPSCQCRQCKQAREAAMQPTGMPGHTANCLCSGCLMQRQMPHAPGIAAFGVPNQLPHHPMPGIHQSLPGFQQPVPRLPGF